MANAVKTTRTARRVRRMAAKFMTQITPNRIRNVIRRLKKAGCSWRQVRQVLGIQKKPRVS